MDIEKRIGIYIDDSYYVNTLSQLLDYCRYCQEKYDKGESEYSGINVLDQILKDGRIKMSMYVPVRYAIENYNTPYTITIDD